jgi:hypothetical protein
MSAEATELNGVFIEVEVDDSILCVEAAPPGTIVVRKLYDGTELRR